MKFEVTRDIVNDLWPLCQAGEASADSRTLVNTFLAADAGFASTLRQSAQLPHAMPAIQLSAEGERHLLDQARDRARLKLIVIGGAILLVMAVAVIALVGAMFFLGNIGS